MLRTPPIARSLALLCAWCALAGAATASVTEYTIFRAPIPPVLDGEVSADSAWAGAPEATGFRVLGGEYAATKQTAVRMVWDDEAIYLAVMAEEPDSAQLNPLVKDGGAPWSEDSVEVFLQPGPPTGQVYQLGVSAGGAKGAGAGEADVRAFSAASHIGAGSYTLEVRVPWAALQAQPPRPGGKWRGTVGRNIFVTTSGGDKFTCLSPLRNQFLEPANFADLLFSDRVLTAAQAEEAGRSLNADYRRYLVTALSARAGLAKDYQGALRSASGDARRGTEATALLARWDMLAGLAAQSTAASTTALREGLSQTADLVPRSHELKYRILLDQLILD